MQRRYRVLNARQAQQAGDLELEENDLIEEIRMLDNGLILCKNSTNNELGLVSANSVELRATPERRHSSSSSESSGSARTTQLKKFALVKPIKNPVSSPTAQNQNELNDRKNVWDGELRGKKARNRRNKRPTVKRSRTCSVLCSVLSALFISSLNLFLMFSWFDYSLRTSILASSTLLFILTILFISSRLLRCTTALMLPTASTYQGRISCLILLGGLLLKGPIENIYDNVGEICRSLSCATELSYNQSEILLQPFDAMMQQLNHTSHQLQSAANNITRRFIPLNESLIQADKSFRNGDVILKKTAKVFTVFSSSFPIISKYIKIKEKQTNKNKSSSLIISQKI